MKKVILFILLFAAAAGFVARAQSVGSSPIQTVFESENKTTVSAFGNILYVLNAPEASTVEVRSMLGEKVFEARINNSEKEEFYLNVKKGIYIVKIGNTLQRVVIK